ncbi:hypothetical protein H072_6641 [Dactylellina haptotyla CBS 200.50]|uniref:Peptidase A1 domain-containing protein n=1 Tax=Dactylellina haptotyla (strain CBS 200.50) TaxID=1284197 RepID=S8BJK7_DACHA|nr:hypothetical protein H072_6641 [Dactylellina haptotyla CBS 200.50]
MGDKHKFCSGAGVLVLVTGWWWFMVQHSFGGASDKHLSSRDLVYITERADKQYVVLPTTYAPLDLGNISLNVVADFSFGPDHQPIKLVVTPQHVTWVPHQPDSLSQFCPSNAETRGACKIGGSYGYYSPKSTTRKNDTFFFSETYNATSISNVTGNWVEDIIKGGDVEVSLRFGAADMWHSSPLLGLGIFPTNRDFTRPSYLEALVTQGKIATGAYLSFYNIRNTTAPGEIILGGVDRSKFFGWFAVYENRESAGEVDGPSVMVSFSRDNVAPIDYRGPSLTLIDPSEKYGNKDSYLYAHILRLTSHAMSTRSIYVPRDVYNTILDITKIPTLQRNPAGDWAVYCSWRIPEDYYINLYFNSVLVKLLLEDLKGSDPSDKDTTSDLCTLNLLPIDKYADQKTKYSYIFGGAFFNAAYVVLSPENNITGIATIRKNTTRDIVQLGGALGTNLTMMDGNVMDYRESYYPEAEKRRIAKIVGSVVAGVVVPTLLVGIIIWFYRRKKEMPRVPSPPPYPAELSPLERPARELEGTKLYFELGDIDANKINNVVPNR